MGKRKDLKISISNLGPIKEAEIELKPLTIFIGPNNTGKTWAAYSVAASFEMLKEFINEYNYKKYTDYFDKELIEEEEGCFSINAEKVFEKLDFEKYISDNFELYFNNFMFLDKEKKGAKVHITNLNTKVKENFFREEKRITFESDTMMRIDPLTSKKLKKVKDSFKIILCGSKNKKAAAFFLDFLIIAEIHTSIYKDIKIFPSERTSLSYMSDLLVYRYFKNIDINKEKIPKYPKPIRDYISLVGDLKNFDSSTKKKKLIDIFEKEILSGEIDTEKGDLGNEIKYYFKDGNLKIHATSSLVKALSIFYLYIRNYGYKNKLFIIDEPAMNLHPEAQVKFMEFISMLVNDGAHFIITTHTPYIVDHLINLMAASKSKKKEEIQELFFLKDKKAFISPNKVAVYEFTKEGKVKDILDRKEITINWETFSKISDRISDIYFKI